MDIRSVWSVIPGNLKPGVVVSLTPIDAYPDGVHCIVLPEDDGDFAETLTRYGIDDRADVLWVGKISDTADFARWAALARKPGVILSFPAGLQAEDYLAAGRAGLFTAIAPTRGMVLCHFEKRPYSVRHPAAADSGALVQLEDRCWPELLRSPVSELKRRLETFPSLNCAVDCDGRLVGVIYTQRIARVDWLDSAVSTEVGRLAEPEGEVAQLISLNVDPGAGQPGLGDQLLEFILQYAALLPGVTTAAAVTLCRDYAGSRDVAALEDYVRRRDIHGLPVDPILRMHVSHGAVIRGLAPGYRPLDVRNLGCGVVVEYDLTSRRAFPDGLPAKGISDSRRIHQAILEALSGSGTDTGFDENLAWSEMGLDSLDLAGLRLRLNAALGSGLDSAAFFRLPTPRALAAYLEGERVRQQHSEKAKPPVPPSIHYAAPPNAIAIVGMACRFPGGANTPEKYWQILREGTDAIGAVPSDRPSAAAFRHGGFLEAIDRFDAAFFRIAPREAAFVDPQQRLLLETAWEALERAGIAPTTLAETLTGVFIGLFSHDYEILSARDCPAARGGPYFASGNSPSVAAGRIAYFLGAQGPAVAVDTACSSSMAAIHLACQSLRTGESELALAGGVNLILTPDLSATFAEAGMLSPTGRCRSFDAAADGYVRSEGCAMFVLKTLDRASADRDPVLAVIRGTAMNQDGASNGLTAPNGKAQQAVIRKALDNARIEPGGVSYVESHGTGTPLGDPIEAEALGAVYSEGRAPGRPLFLGSAKSNIGHTEAAAGAAGLMKVVLALQHGIIPAHLHFETPNPRLDLDRIPARIPVTAVDWPASTEPRYAGVSSFGFSGTNLHMIVEEAPRLPPDPLQTRGTCVVSLSAQSPHGLRERARQLAGELAAHPELAAGDVALTCNTGRAHFDHRLAFTAESTAEIAADLKEFTATASISDRLWTGMAQGSATPDVVFLFPGQGSQYTGMARELYRAQPVFRNSLDLCVRIVSPLIGRSLTDLIYPVIGGDEELRDTAFCQPVLFAIGFALSEMWRSWGIAPAAVLGHSVGEYVAACLAGVFSLEDGLRLIAARGRIIGSLPREGEMWSVPAGRDLVAAVITRWRREISIAAVNAPEQTVISGSIAALREAAEEFQRLGFAAQPLPVSHAFHSPLMAPILDDFRRVAETVRFDPPVLPMISNVSGAFAGAEVADPEYWIGHISRPVLFRDGIRSLYDKGYRTFLECGPQTTLLSLAKRSLPVSGSSWLFNLHPSLPDWRCVLRSVAQLYVNGAPIKWAEVHRGSAGQRIALPTYPFDRQRYWLDLLPAVDSAPAKSLEQLLLETDATEISKALDWIEELSGAEADAMLRGAV